MRKQDREKQDQSFLQLKILFQSSMQSETKDYSEPEFATLYIWEGGEGKFLNRLS